MKEQDTINLLRELDLGLKMGICAMEDALKQVESERFQKLLTDSLHSHRRLRVKVRERLNSMGEEGKQPNPLMKLLCKIKLQAMLCVDASEKTVACLLTDGSNMGIKAVCRELNRLSAADAESKSCATELITQEETLLKALQQFL